MLMVIMKRDGTLTKPPMQQAQANNYLKKLINANRYASLGQALNDAFDGKGKATNREKPPKSICLTGIPFSMRHREMANKALVCFSLKMEAQLPCSPWGSTKISLSHRCATNWLIMASLKVSFKRTRR
jgi:hypothetical protein